MYERYEVLNSFLENQDFYEKAIDENIKKYRCGTRKVRLVDKGGKPLSGAKVLVTQKSHQFRFGANLFMLDELETDKKNKDYKDYFCRPFNMATLPFYWNDCEPERGKPRYDKDSPKWYRRPPVDLCLEFCEENGIEPREHALAYERLFPSWLKDVPVSEIKEAFEKRCQELSRRYAHRINTIEVTNEMNWHEGTTAFYNEPDYIEWCFKTTEKYFPSNQLVINEATEEAWLDVLRPTAKYYAYTEAAILKGARVDAIGLQFHMFYTKEDEAQRTRHLYDPISLYRHMDLYSRLVNKLQITEVTVPAYSYNSDDEEIQARLLTYLYKLWFSHPACEQIIYWNLVDGYAYVPDPTPEKIRRTQGNMSVGENYYYGGLLRFDLTPKPAYYALENLIKNEWHTCLELCTDKDGWLEFNGFWGTYEVEVVQDGKTLTAELSHSSNVEESSTLII
ncbi:MAG: endo-1,4-beta-xylanase [Clostridia bacterium]|nr:endo-1,4-beta-xylanase [Clostridia bacterium]